MPRCPIHAVTTLDSAFSNQAFRRVLATWRRMQAVAMSLRPGEDIGAETHRKVEQTFIVISGSGTAVIDGRHVKIEAGDVFAACRGQRHNVKAGKGGLKLFTLYSPPNHLDGRIHMTKADAHADLEDEEFGRGVGG